jgi:hypothetical protein
VKKFLLSWVLLFVLWMAGSYLVHAVLLTGEYSQLPNLFRTTAETEKYSIFMLLAHVLMAGAFAWIYARGISSAPWLGQGIRYGFAIAFMTVVPTYMIYYVVQPLPGSMVVKQILYDGALVVVLGVVVAWVQRGSARG